MQFSKSRSFLFAAMSVVAVPAMAADVAVTVGDASFDTSFHPSTVPIHSGDRVVFTSNSSIAHNVTSDDGGATFNSGAAAVGPWTLTTGPLTAPITFHCSVHGTAGTGGQPGTGMAGSIVLITTPVRLQSMDVQP